MTSLEFIKKELQGLAEKFPNIHIKYGFDEIIETHIVEMSPPHEYYNNRCLDKAWIPVSLQFLELFLDEDITFISSDSSLKIEEVILEFNQPSYIDEYIIT